MFTATHNHQSGYSLVEVLIAITVLLLAIAGPLTIASKGLQSAYFAREQATALYLAQEGMEVVTALRNQAYVEQINSASPDFDAIWTDDWAIDVSNCGSGTDGCGVPDYDDVFAPGGSFVPCGNQGQNCVLQRDDSGNGPRYVLDAGAGLEDSIYTRIVTLDVGSDSVDVTVLVRWTTPLFAGAAQEIVLRSTLENYLSDFSNL